MYLLIVELLYNRLDSVSSTILDGGLGREISGGNFLGKRLGIEIGEDIE
jgi:hypothetical protein